jgi:drug/metabolite transporter, DME family
VKGVRRTGLLAITMTALLWGTTGTAATFVPSVGPLAIGAWALGIGGVLQAAIAVPALHSAAPVLRQHLLVVVTGAVAVAIYPLAFYSSMDAAGVAVGSVVSLASAPLASGALERVVDGRPLSRWWVAAAGLGAIGSGALCASKLDAQAQSASSTLVGIGLGLVAGATYATYSWASHRLMESGISRSASMGAVFGGGGLLLVPVVAFTAAPLLVTPQAFMVGAYMALVPMFLGYLLFGFGLTRIPASTATTVTLIEPAVATVLAVLVVGERLTPLGWTGLLIIAVVLVILTAAPTLPGSASPSTELVQPPQAAVR